MEKENQPRREESEWLLGFQLSRQKKRIKIIKKTQKNCLGKRRLLVGTVQQSSGGKTSLGEGPTNVRSLCNLCHSLAGIGKLAL